VTILTILVAQLWALLGFPIAARYVCVKRGRRGLVLFTAVALMLAVGYGLMQASPAELGLGVVYNASTLGIANLVAACIAWGKGPLSLWIAVCMTAVIMNLVGSGALLYVWLSHSFGVGALPATR
jgi:hypothetical protein